MPIACATIFFHTDIGELTARYEANTENPCGYLTRVNGLWIFVDAQATETADWARQMELATLMTDEGEIGISVFLVNELWALGISFDGKLGPVAAYVPDDETQMRQLPQRLLAIESVLDDLFPEEAVPEQIDELFGATLEGAKPFEDMIDELLEMLGVPPEWQRWGWYEMIPEQLFIDPDLTDRVFPIGDACQFWEE
jgi:hypothetical protein